MTLDATPPDSWDFARRLRSVNERLILSLVRSHEKLEAAERDQAMRSELLDAIDIGVVEFDRHAICSWANRSAGEIVGLTPAGMVGKRLTDLFDPCAGDHLAEAFEECRLYREFRDASQIGVADCTLRRQDGTPFSAAYSLHPIRRGGDLSGAVFVVADIGQRRQAEVSIREAEIHAAQLEGATVTVRELSHQLNNYMAIAVLELDTFADNPALTSSQQAVLQRISRALDAVSARVESFSHLDRIALYQTPIGPSLDLARSQRKAVQSDSSDT